MSSAFKVPCSYCGKGFALSGIGRHETACLKKMKEAEVIRQVHQAALSGSESVATSSQLASNGLGLDRQASPSIDVEMSEVPESYYEEPNPDAWNEPPRPKFYIRTRYHPRTGLPDQITDLDAPDTTQAPPSAPSISGFSPFPTMKDFTYAEEMITTCASARSINHHLRNGYPDNKLRSAKQIYECVDNMAAIYPGFEPKTFQVPFTQIGGNEVKLEYTVWVKDSMKVLEELVRDPTLKDQWKWHAHAQYIKLGDQEEELFVTGPMTAKDAWEAEQYLPNGVDHVQIPLQFYSDKSNAAKFAQFAVHPVCMRPASLPQDIINHNGEYAGNNMVGLLPKITVPPGEEKNKRWPNTLSSIFHKAMELIFEPLASASRYGKGCWCGDGNQRVVYPRAAIASQDLEEQYLSAGTRGNAALFPCPRCLVPHDQLSEVWDSTTNLIKRWEQRKQVDSIDAINKAKSLPAGEAEEMLRGLGLREIQNAWWTLSLTDVHRALSFDLLHSIWHGVWGDHVFPMLLTILDRDAFRILEECLRDAPSFPGLLRVNHLKSKLDFADGKKYFSVLQAGGSKQEVHAHPLTIEASKSSPMVLAEVALQAEIKMQTKSRIRCGEESLAKFGQLLPHVISLFPEKNFDFPKIHQLTHLWDDILHKGTSDYFGTLIGENFHQGLIKAYAASNGREAQKHILRQDCRYMAISRIRWRLHIAKKIEESKGGIKCGEEETDEADETNVGPSTDVNDIPQPEHVPGSRVFFYPQKFLEGVEKGFVASDIVTSNGGHFPDVRGKLHFSNFHSDLLQFISVLRSAFIDLTHQLPPIPDSWPPTSVPLTPYRTIKHLYYSCDDGKLHQDPIRCNPSFFRRPRFDCVLVQTAGGIRPARLHLVFEVSAFDIVWQLARVTYFTAITSTLVDRDIGMLRYEEEVHGKFIALDSIIRSCYLSSIPAVPRQFYLNDLIAGDVDLFLRIKAFN